MVMFTSMLISFIISILYLKPLDLFLITAFSICMWSIIKITVFRVKFIYFLLFILIMAIWGMYASLDGFMLLLVMTEFLVILLFLITSMSFNFISNSKRLPNALFFVFYLATLLAYFWVMPSTISTFTHMYHKVYHYGLEVINSADLFTFFWGFFVEHNIIVFYITLILSLFSMFFIWSYYTLRYLEQTGRVKAKTIELIRKQQSAKQALYKPHLRMFKK